MYKQLPQLKAITHMRQSGRMSTEVPLVKELMERKPNINKATASVLLTFMLLGWKAWYILRTSKYIWSHKKRYRNL